MKKKNKNNYIKKLHANKYPNKRKAVCKGQLRENPSRNKKVRKSNNWDRKSNI